VLSLDVVHDVVVIGSGYGGAVIAARLAGRANVLLIERGRWWKPGQFPSGVLGLARAYLGRRNPGGLWAMRLGDGTGNAFASAFGGSSAVNYGITARPDDHALAGWPLPASALQPYFDRAAGVLGASRNPLGDVLGDKEFLDLLEPGRRVDLENTIDWSRCDQCGRCVPGCNSGAKRSLDQTYLALAMSAGAEVRLETEVRSIEPLEDGWGIEIARAGDAAVERLRTRELVLAAGTLGTLDILHRSRDRLPLTAWFGREMSMNGDGLAFLYDTRYRLSSHHGAPISTSVRIPFQGDDGSTRTLMVMSGRVPMAAMRFTAASLALLAGVIGEATGRGFPAHPMWLRFRDLFRVDQRGALSRSFMYKLDGQDQSRGTARFTAGGAVIDWPDYADDPVNRFADRRLHEWAAKVGGTVIPNIARLPGMRSFSVHPLGGCRIGAGPDDGVVDLAGRVFDPRGGVYRGLRIADGSIVPGSLGVPPSLTISALAERIAEQMLADRAAA